MFWVVIIILTVFIAYWASTRNHCTFKLLSIPGPRPWPLIGNLPCLIKYGMISDDHLVKEYGRIFGYFEGMIPVLFIADVDYIKQVTIKYFDKFRNRRILLGQEELNKAVSLLEDEEWKIIRNVITPTFTSGKLKKIVPLIDDCAKRMNTRLQGMLDANKFEIETKDGMGSFTINVVAETLFGVRMDDDLKKAQNFIDKSKKVFEEFNFLKPALFFCFVFPSTRIILEKLGIGLLPKDCMDFYKSQVLSIIKLRRRNAEKPYDFLQLLLDAHASDEGNKNDQAANDEQNKWKDVKKRALTEEEIVANCVLFFLGGFETTTLTIAWILHLLSIHQGVQEKLFEEINANISKTEPLTFESISKLCYLEQIIYETLRLYPAAARTDRVCNESCVVGSYHIPKGMVLNLGIRAVHLDEEYWHEPNRFDPDRFSPERKHEIIPYSFIPFGLGPRDCIGKRLALLEIKICVIRLIEEFKILRCSKTEEFPKMKTNTGLTIPIGSLWVRLDKRN